MPHKPSIELRDPADLKPHPLKKQLPKPASWQKGGDDFNRLLEDIRDRGVTDPLKVDATGLILDGEICWQAAKILHLPEVPVMVIKDEPASVILGGLLQRRHFGKSALAYVTFPLFTNAFEEARRRHLGALRQGTAEPFSRSTGNVLRAKTVEELAEQAGFSRVLFFQARQLHEVFTRTPALRAQFEPDILSGEKGLGAVIAGIAGQASTSGKAKQTAAQLELFNEGLGTVTKRFTYWQKFDEVTKEAARKTIHETVEAMPDDLREEFEKAIRAAKKERKAA